MTTVQLPHLEHKIGDTLILTCTLTLAGQAVNLTGYTIDVLYENADDEELASQTIGTGVTVIDAAAGVFKSQVNDTSEWTGSAYMEVSFLSPGGVRETKDAVLIELIQPRRNV